MGNLRPPAVAGMFYPRDPGDLEREITTYLKGVREKPGLAAIKALIVPHAGYVYSGPIAASAYGALCPMAASIHRVVLLGPTHRTAIRGLALAAAAAYATPLGSVPVDQSARESLADLEQVVVSDGPHAQEHSLEVQLPFLQRVLGSFTLVPLAVGSASPMEVSQVLERLWGGPETLIVISSDLSHYLPYGQARTQDQATCQRILQGQADIRHDEACGATPINGLLLAARTRHLHPQLLDLRNSGDTAGDKSRVVGYAAFAFEPPHAH